MERSLADELYSEVLQGKVDLDQTSVSITKQCHSCDGEDEELWYEDGAPWNGPDGELDKSSEWKILGNQFHTIGYRDGIIEGKQISVQEGFNVGFKESVYAGFNWGLVRGVTNALAFLPGELREKIIESEEIRKKFSQLNESVNKLSTADALKLFHDDLTNKMVKQSDNVGGSLPSSDLQDQSSDGSLLDNYYGELQALILKSPALEVQSEIKQ